MAQTAPAPPAAGPRPSRSRRLLWNLLSLALAVGCFALAFHDVPLGQLARQARDLSAPLLLLAAGLMALTNLVKSAKLGLLLAGARRLRLRTLFAAEMIATLVDVLLPLRLLELVKAYLLGRRQGIGPGFVLGAVVVERGVDVMVHLSALALLGLLLALPSWFTLALWGGLAGLLAGAALLLLLVLRPESVQRPLERLQGTSLPGARGLAGALGRLLQGMRQAAVRPAALLAVLLITVVEYGMLAAAFWACAAALGLPMDLPRVLAMMAANTLSFTVPTSSASAVGIYEYAMKTALVTLFAVPPAAALSLALLCHVLVMGVAALQGTACLVLSRVTLAELRAGAAGEAPPPDAPA